MAMATDMSQGLKREYVMTVAQRRRMIHQVRSEYGKKIRKGYENHEIDAKRSEVQVYETRKDGLSNCITTVTSKDCLYIGKIMDGQLSLFEEDIEEVREEIDDGYEGSEEYWKKVDEAYRERERTELAVEPGKTLKDYLYKDYGIFKLSPRECGRLMGVSDDDIDKMQLVISNSQQYRCFGNSICVPVLMAIFSQLNIKGVKPWNELSQGEREDLINRTISIRNGVRE